MSATCIRGNPAPEVYSAMYWVEQVSSRERARGDRQAYRILLFKLPQGFRGAAIEHGEDEIFPEAFSQPRKT